MSEPHWRAEVTFRVPFHDVDMMGFVWYGHYPRYFEAARERLLLDVDYGYHAMVESGYAWPVIDLHLRYAQPMRCEQEITVRARVREYENRLRIGYEIRDTATGDRLTRGETVQVAVDMASNEMCLVTPAILRRKLGVADALA